MSRELREEVARAIFHAKYPTGTTWEQWAKQVEKRGGFDGRDWSRKLAEAALTAARPVIERETREACAVIVETVQFPDKVLGDNRSESGKFKRASRTSINAQPPRRMLAAAIRGEPT